MIDALHLLLERLLKGKNRSQHLRRLTYFALPLLKFRICALKPGEILLPFAYVGKKMREVPFVRLGNFRTSCDGGRHSENVQRPTPNVQQRIQTRLLERRSPSDRCCCRGPPSQDGARLV